MASREGRTAKGVWQGACTYCVHLISIGADSPWVEWLHVVSEYVVIKGNRWLEREMKTQRERAGFLPVESSTGSDSGWDRQCSDSSGGYCI
jgi:hypothetical protein